MSEQKGFIDFNIGLGDTGQDNLASIQPFANGEGATQDVLRRAPENLRERSEVLREQGNELLYYRDYGHLMIEYSGGTLTWSGPGNITPLGKISATGGTIKLSPMLAPSTGKKGSLNVGTVSVNRIIYTVAAGAFATHGMNSVFVEHRDGGSGATAAVAISEGPVKRILVVFDAANTAHDAATISPLLTAAIAADTGTGGLAGKITITTSAVAGQTIATLAETRIETTADDESHVITAADLQTLTTATPLNVGMGVAIWYRYLIEPSGGFGSDPKAGLAGGRAESSVSRGTSAIPAASLFVTDSNPEKIPGAIPLCRVGYGGQLIWYDGTRLEAGESTQFLSPASAAATALAAQVALYASQSSGQGAALVGYDGSGPWADATTLPASTVNAALDNIVSNLAAVGGAGKVGLTPAHTLTSATVKAAADDLDYRLIKAALGLHGPAIQLSGPPDLNDVVYANSTFVAVGQATAIRTSPTGEAWTTRTAGAGAGNFKSVAYGAGTFVAVGDDIQTSATGVTWVEQLAISNFNDVIYAGGQFVAVGNGGIIYTSPDGFTWTVRTAAAPTSDFFGIAYGGGLYVITGTSGGGNAYIETSPDGITWTTRTLTSPTTGTLTCVHYYNGRFITGLDDAGSPGIVTSTNGTTWTTVTHPVSWNQAAKRVRVIGGVWVIVSYAGEMVASQTGTSWDLLRYRYTSNITTIDFNGIASDGNTVAIACSSKGIRTAHLKEIASNLLRDLQSSDGAAQIGSEATGTVVATTVQNAIAELASEKAQLNAAVTFTSMTATTIATPSVAFTRRINSSYAASTGDSLGARYWGRVANYRLESRVQGTDLYYPIDHCLNQGDIITSVSCVVDPGTARTGTDRMSIQCIRNLSASGNSVSALGSIVYDDETANQQTLTISGIASNNVVDKTLYTYHIVIRAGTGGSTDFAYDATVSGTRTALT